jgi:hypothetical protein
MSIPECIALVIGVVLIAGLIVAWFASDPARAALDKLDLEDAEDEAAYLEMAKSFNPEAKQ